MLKLLLLLPLIAFVIILLIPKHKIILIKKISLFFSLIILIHTITILIKLRLVDYYFVFKTKINFILGIEYFIGIDGISIFFIILMAMLIPICLLVNWESIKFRNKDFTLLLFLLEFLVFNIFVSLDIFFFFFFWRSSNTYVSNYRNLRFKTA
jgi:NADH-quinone oxidoreductase subunit M